MNPFPSPGPQMRAPNSFPPGQMFPARTGGLTNFARAPGLIGTGGAARAPVNIMTVLENVQKMFQVAETMGPMFRQYGPAVKNLPNLVKKFQNGLTSFMPKEKESESQSDGPKAEESLSFKEKLKEKINRSRPEKNKNLNESISINEETIQTKQTKRKSLPDTNIVTHKKRKKTSNIKDENKNKEFQKSDENELMKITGPKGYKAPSLSRKIEAKGIIEKSQPRPKLYI
ncbi:VrrA/YqfQ family protein [Fictibacillus sp. Mic-4]|uniref:VrrA/YqfQ family protein n=1 Tax=Fictibacillus sp. Mic-4 TaxID=3132826 RepID=UPI003CE98D24